MNRKVEKFEDLEVWEKGMRLAVKLYQILQPCKDFSLRDQIQRSAVSIPSNIAEGFERNSNKEFIQFLYIAKNSCAILRTQTYIAKEVGIFDQEKGNEILEKTTKISAMLYNLIRTRKEKF